MSNYIKFVEDQQSGEDVFIRNGIYEYRTKYETVVDGKYLFMYVIDFEGKTYTVPDTCIVEVDKVINRDRTKESWREFVTQDLLVEDGNYTKAWKDTFGVTQNKSIDLCDYDSRWKRLQKEIEKKYGNDEGFIES